MLRSITPLAAVRDKLLHGLYEVMILIRAHCLLMRRRPLTQILLWVLLGTFAISIGFHIALYALAKVPTSGNNCTSSGSAAVQGGQQVPCLSMTNEQRKQQDMLKVELLHEQQQTLAFPGSLGLAGSELLSIGVLLFCILVAVLAGSEYHYGTQRLAFSRGVSRHHFLFAQVIMLALLAVVLACIVLVSSAIVGFAIGPAIGGNITWPSLQGWGEIVLYWLSLSLALWMYALLTLFITTLGRSMGAGLIGIICFLAVQALLLPSIGPITSSLPKGVFSWLFNRLPDLFLSTNIKFLLSAATSSPIMLTSQQNLTSSDLFQIAIACCCYIGISIGGCLWFLQKRDPGM